MIHGVRVVSYDGVMSLLLLSIACSMLARGEGRKGSEK
jgi:hypothetical protein